MASASATERSPMFLRIIEGMLSDPSLSHLYFDISWDEVAKYATATPESLQHTADIINRYPDRFLFGTDNVAPENPEAYFGVYEMYAPLWAKLTPKAKAKILKGNYERLFDAASRKVRAWEKAHVADSK
jgi:predicted TIM-barrel fold metal-dependent hydrolase